MFKLAACIVLASAIGASADACDKPECQNYNVKCVGEGAYCVTDLNTGFGGCSGTFGTRSACYQCASADLICSSNKCIKKVDFGVSCCPYTNNPNSCDPEVRHSFCLDTLNCENATGFGFPARGTCNNTKTVYLAVGDACDPLSTTEFCYNQGGASVTCDATARRCIFFNTFTQQSNEGSCYSTVDCKPGFYCPAGATQATPASCTPAYPTTAATLNKPCNPQNASQCGAVMQCYADNAFESSTNFMTYSCKYPYSRALDEACDTSTECGGGGICTNGWCTPVQGPCLGRQCSFNGDCTDNKNTMTCSCPPTEIGGGYQRCIANSAYQNQWQNKYLWDNYLRAYYQCLADNNCPYTSNPTAFKCSVNNCQAVYNRLVNAGKQCTNTQPLWGRSYPSSASAVAPAVSLLALAAAVFAAQRNY